MRLCNNLSNKWQPNSSRPNHHHLKPYSDSCISWNISAWRIKYSVRVGSVVLKHMHQHLINCKAICPHMELVLLRLRRRACWNEPVILRKIFMVLLEEEVKAMEEDCPVLSKLCVWLLKGIFKLVHSSTQIICFLFCLSHSMINHTSITWKTSLHLKNNEICKAVVSVLLRCNNPIISIQPTQCNCCPNKSQISTYF